MRHFSGIMLEEEDSIWGDTRNLEDYLDLIVLDDSDLRQKNKIERNGIKIYRSCTEFLRGD